MRQIYRIGLWVTSMLWLALSPVSYEDPQLEKLCVQTDCDSVQIQDEAEALDKLLEATNGKAQ